MARYDFCPHCGTVNNGGDFCANCGAPLTAPDAGSPQDMQTVPIPVLTTPQGYLDQDGRPIDLSQMAQDFPPDEPHRRGISKKTITVIAALVVVLIVVLAVCGWMIWSNRQRGSQLAACQSAVSSVKASESKAKSEYETAENFPKPVRRSWTMHRCLRILPMPSGRRSRSQPMTMSATRPMARLGCALSESRPARI